MATSKSRPKGKGQPGINTDWFVKRIEERGHSQRGVAKLMRLDPSALHLMLKGQRNMKAEEAVEIARILDLPLPEVLKNAGIRVGLTSGGAKRDVRVAGWIDSAGVAEIAWTGSSGESVDGPPDLPDGAVAVQVRAAGADFTPLDGWLLFVTGLAKGVNPEAIGRLSLCKIKGAAHVVGHIKRGYRRGSHTVVALGGAVLKDADLEFAVPVHWIRVA